MDDMKDKVKGFMKKVNSQLPASSSGKFKGQGRVLGSSSSGSSNPIPSRSAQNFNSKPNSVSTSTNSKPAPRKPSPVNSNQNTVDRSAETTKPTQKLNPSSGFDPFDSLITNGNRTQHGYSLNVFECPICGKPFGSEEEVSIHVESCLNDSNSAEPVGAEGGSERNVQSVELNGEVEVYVGTYLSGKPSDGSIEVVLKLFKNIAKEPENAKFRKIRLSNPKIKESVIDVTGGMELLEFVGFELSEENGETWALMKVPSEDGISLITKVVTLLEQLKVQEPEKRENLTSISTFDGDVQPEPKKVDRQVKVFFSVPESVAAKIELPDSFFKLRIEEVRREAELRRKKIADSQLLIPKSYKEKQTKAARKKYTRCLIRIQFPDGVVLQGVFAPWESTTALYEFVSSALKEPSLEFELLDPVLVRRRVIPRFPAAGAQARTLYEEDLVPSALIKFKPIETDSVVFTGLRNDLLEIIEPLVQN